MEEIDYLYVMNIVETFGLRSAVALMKTHPNILRKHFQIESIPYIISLINSDQLILAKLIPVFKGFDADQLKYSLPG